MEAWQPLAGEPRQNVFWRERTPAAVKTLADKNAPVFPPEAGPPLAEKPEIESNFGGVG